MIMPTRVPFPLIRSQTGTDRPITNKGISNTVYNLGQNGIGIGISSGYPFGSNSFELHAYTLIGQKKNA